MFHVYVKKLISEFSFGISFFVGKLTQEVYATVTSGFFHNFQYFIKIEISQHIECKYRGM